MSSAAPAQPTDLDAPDANPRTGKYLIFLLGLEEFGIRVTQVQEIMGIQEITTIPQTPPFIKGVINLRGKVIPLLDLRLKFGFPPEPYTSRTCIIVVRTRPGREQLTTGIIVDEVAEVANLVAQDIEDAPDFGKGVETNYLLGMAKVKDKVKILIDIDEILRSPELHTLDALSQR
jgi:purine-binding chemotaxis protein CheW